MRDSYTHSKPKTSPHAVLLIFDRGFDAFPVVVPNSGNEQLDELIMQWLQRKLLTAQNERKAAA